MKSAITNIGRQFVTNNTTGGAWFAITHFALAWVNAEERLTNPPTDTATELVKTQPSGQNNGDYIFNIWQTPFTWDATGRLFGVGDSRPQGYGMYFRYDYDVCDQRNTLTVYNPGMEGLPSGARINGTKFYGASEGSTSGFSGTYSGGSSSDLTMINIPAPLAYNSTTAVYPYSTTTTSKYFPIKAFRAIESTDDTINAQVSLMDYVLELPAVTANTLDASYALQNSIGNFKFNRIGLYVTKSSSPDPIPQLITSLTPMADTEPVLFAMIDLASDEICGGDILNIYKTRDDSGLSAFSFDAQLSLTSVISSEAFASAVSLYRDSARDDATNSYLNQLESTSNTVEAIMQLQMQVIQLSQYLKNITGTDPVLSNNRGFGSLLTLQPNNEYYLSSQKNNIYYFKGDLIRSVDPTIIVGANEIFNIRNSVNSSISDGDVIKLIIDNLDGRTYTSGTTVGAFWTGNIYITNYDGTNKFKIGQLDYNTLKGYAHAKVSIELIFNANNNTWILSELNVVDESSLY